MGGAGGFCRVTDSRGRVGILVEGRYLHHEQPRGLQRALRRRGVPVSLLVAEALSPELSAPDWTRGLAVVVARGRSEAALSLLRSAERVGVPVVNSVAAVQGVVDKAGMATTLATARVPTPRTWLGTPERLAALRGLHFPVILKPVTGDNSRGLVVVRSRAELGSVSWPHPVALAQDFHRGDGYDVKLYVAGHTMWAVRRPSPINEDGSPRADTDAGAQVPVTPAMETIVARCRHAFGLRLFGVDCVLGPRGELLAVEVNEYPNYRGLPHTVDDILADVTLGDVVSSPVANRHTREQVTA